MQDDRRFRAILEAALDAVIGMDAEGRITEWNGQAETVFGWSAAEVLGRSLAGTIIPPRYRDAHHAGLTRYLATGEGPVLNRRIEITAWHREGREFPVELAIATLEGPGGASFSAFVRDITERKQAEAELRDRQAYLDGLFEGAPEAIVLVDGNDHVVRVNREFTRLFGYCLEELAGQRLDEFIVPAERRAELEGYRLKVRTGGSVSVEAVRRHRDGTEIPVSILSFPIGLASGETAAYSIYRDISARLRLEDQLLQARKMESIGRLAGGVAHDFNNILTAILGYLNAAQADLRAGVRPDADLAEVERAARRAADLTRQLLGFARRQIAKPRVVDLNTLISSMRSLLARLLGERIDLRLELDQGLGVVRLDPSQFEQILVNLAVNSRDAMPTGGSLQLTTRNAILAEGTLPPGQGLSAGPYAELAVRDTGAGMDSATLARVFEPFFTTKAVGSGTGLGLATCYGIIRQSGGHITVQSVPGGGTTFQLFFPHVDASAGARQDSPPALGPLRGSETVLVVEDEERLRELFARILGEHGYRVLVAGSGPEALQVVGDYSGVIDLLVTAVTLPETSGRAIAEQLASSRPGLRVLYVSGYGEDAILEHAGPNPALGFLSKPFGAPDLARRVRELLDQTG
jgi:two-component system, cell cycle sensor histidine kinase and response regulator CckA